MEITHLDRSFLYDALAWECIKRGQLEKNGGSYECFPEASNLGCPFETENGESVDCGQIRTEHWRLVFEGEDEQEPEPEPEWREVFEGKDEQKPEFSFGDRVTVDGTKAIFIRYTSEEHDRAYIVFGASVLLPERLVVDLKAGWDG